MRPERETKSVSAETTFAIDLTAVEDLEWHLWRLSEKLARRLKAQIRGGRRGVEVEDREFFVSDARGQARQATICRIGCSGRLANCWRGRRLAPRFV